MKTCLIFGGSKFVGRAVANRLVQDGNKVYVLNRGNYPTPKGCIQLTADRNDSNQLNQVLEKLEFNTVFDISAYQPEQTKEAIDCLIGRTGHFIHMSSAAVYMNTEIYPITESNETGSNLIWGDYGTGKHLCEKMLTEYYEKRHFPMTIFRPFYIYGPGNNHDRETYVFKRLVQKKPIIVPGNGRSIVQFGYIDDLVDALVKCILRKNSFGQIYNVSGESYITFKGWIEACARVVGIEPKLLFIGADNQGFETRQWFPFRDINFFGSCEKIKHELGIKPKINLIEGLHNTYNSLNKEMMKQQIIYSEAESTILTRVAEKRTGTLSLK